VLLRSKWMLHNWLTYSLDSVSTTLNVPHAERGAEAVQRVGQPVVQHPLRAIDEVGKGGHTGLASIVDERRTRRALEAQVVVHRGHGAQVQGALAPVTQPRQRQRVVQLHV